MKLLHTSSFLALAFLSACSGPAPVRQAPAVPPAVPPEVQGAAVAVLGRGAEVLAYGDLAKIGNQHVLAINRAPSDAGAIEITRCAIVSKEGNQWREIFRADEHLKNPKGFLAATPRTAVIGWTLQYEEVGSEGIRLRFTPHAQKPGEDTSAIAVRWNPKAGRYQALDRKHEKFLGEVATLEKIRINF